MRDTIFAPATAAGRAAVAVVRMSGPQAGSIASILCGRLPSARRASLRRLQWNGSTLDEALVLWMPGPGSFTGEDCVEFHVHGGPAVVDGVTTALTNAGGRLADPGEFTRRAFEAGRLDLTQAEAMADLIDAQTEAQRRQAVAQMAGALSDRYRLWRENLLDALAFIEAGIDFPEEDVPQGVVSASIPLIARVVEEVRSELADIRGERVREGFRIALVGAPNVGKSSLLNALVQRDAAIVTSTPGTTRDVVEAQLLVAGQLVRLADTAGLRDAGDEIEAEGIRRARLWADGADIRIAVADASRFSTIEFAKGLMGNGDILVINKDDLTAKVDDSSGAVRTVATSDGITSLRQAIEVTIKGLNGGADFPAITRQRHRRLLTDCVTALDRAMSAQGAELAGEDVRLAIRALERVAGRADPEAVLDRVFSTFCIGK